MLDREQLLDRASYIPTQEEIERAKKEIQRGWSEQERLRRQNSTVEDRVSPKLSEFAFSQLVDELKESEISY